MRSLLLAIVAVCSLALPSFLTVSAQSAAGQSALYGPDGPKFDVAAGYQRLQANAPPGICRCFGENGGYVDANYWVTHKLGITGEFSGGHEGNISSLGQNLTLTTFMAGPHFVIPLGRIVPYTEVLLGVAHGSDSYFPTGNSYQTSATSFAYAPGGGIDYDLTRKFSIRLVQARFLHTSFPNGTSNEQNQLMIGTGVDFRFGRSSTYASSKPMPREAIPQPVPVALPPPPPPPPPPMISELACTSAVTEVQAGSTIEVAAIAQTSPDNMEVTYSWSSSGGTILGSGSRVTVDTATLPPGEYHVTGHAQPGSDAMHGRSCDVVFRVDAPPPPPEVVRQLRESDFKANVHDVFFDLNKWNLRPDGEETLKHNAEYLKAHPDVRVTIGGFADERGASKYNLSLGEKRANTVRDELISLGIAGDRVQIVTFGRDAQICTAGTEVCWQQNRRVGFLMQP